MSLRATPPLWLLVLITLSGTMAMHMFVPALPAAAHDLAASVGQMQLTISLYIVGLAVGQLFYGPLSDAYGRRPLLLAGLALYAAAGATAALATGVHMLVIARLVQALGGCAGLVLGRAIVRDTGQAESTVRNLALMNLMSMVGPGLAPVIGGAVTSTLGWRAVFWVMAIFGTLALALSWRLMPETARPDRRFSVRILLADYRTLLHSPRFVGYAVGGGCATTSFYAFLAAAPFVFATQLHRPLHEVGVYLGILIVGIAVGNGVTGRLIGRVPVERLLLGGNALCLLSAGTLLVTLALGHLSVPVTVGAMFVFTCGAGITSPSALSRAVSVDPRLVGSAAGLYGFLQMAIGATCAASIGLGGNPAWTSVIVLLVASLIGQAAIRIAIARE